MLVNVFGNGVIIVGVLVIGNIVNDKAVCNPVADDGKYQNYSDNLYKIELTGEIDPETEINITEITARLSEKLYFVKVKDSTEYKIDLSALANDPSLKGIFVKNMLLKMELAEDKEIYKKALKIGLKAFKSEVNYIED